MKPPKTPETPRLPSATHTPSLPSHWHPRSVVDSSLIPRLQESLHIHELTAQLLLMRGLRDLDLAHHYLFPQLKHLPNPQLLKGLQRACQRIVQALQQQEHIVIYGDYDVDGVTSTSLLFLFLQEIGVAPERLHTFIPHRIEHGYGLQSACFPKLLDMQCRLLITVDCGITSRTEIDKLNALGIDVIVIDHHLPPERLPDAYTILNPRQADCAYPDKNLAAVGVAYQLVIGLRTTLREQGHFAQRPEPNLRRYLDLVAVGTVADIVPLHGVNRILVHHGLAQMKQTQWIGLQALLDKAKTAPNNIDTTTIGFRIGPRINAAGRLAHASLGVELLCTSDPNTAERLANELDHINIRRKALQETIFLQAQSILENDPLLQQERAIVLGHPDWHLGVIGIVASKLLEQWHRPVVLLAFDQHNGIAKGSARSIESFHIHEALVACNPYLHKYGGHKLAAGLTLALDRVDAFRTAFLQLAHHTLSPQDIQPALCYDAVFDPSLLTLPLLEELQRLAPFGAENPSPLLVTPRATLANSRPTNKGDHLQFLVNGRYQAVAFGQKERHPLPSFSALAYRPCINEWQGQRSVQLQIADFA